MHISILSLGTTPKVQRCTSCCKQFHCPLCLKFKPTLCWFFFSVKKSVWLKCRFTEVKPLNCFSKGAAVCRASLFFFLLVHMFLVPAPSLIFLRMCAFLTSHESKCNHFNMQLIWKGQKPPHEIHEDASETWMKSVSPSCFISWCLKQSWMQLNLWVN